MTQRIALDQVIEAAPARVVVTEDASGQVTKAAFDLSGLPRVDAALVGRPVMEVPGLVERLCSICPTAHHLAGMRALESLAGLGELPPTAHAVRRLLHHAGVIGIHVVGLISTDPEEALILRRFSKAAMAAVGSPGHFPVTAVPGGVAAPADPALSQVCAGMVGEAMAAACRVAERALGTPVSLDRFDGADLALIDAQGRLDLFGQALRAVAADGSLVIEAAHADEWDSLVAEADPGSPTPRPYLVPLGPGAGKYRVGPVAQLRVGPLSTPVAVDLQQSWHSHHGGAHAARAIITVHAVEVIAALLDDPVLCHPDDRHDRRRDATRQSLLDDPVLCHSDDPVLCHSDDPILCHSDDPILCHSDDPILCHPAEGRISAPASSASLVALPWPATLPAGVGVGWVDGARGLLSHRYAIDEDGRVTAATILTPTAQNEPWLGDLLRAAATDSSDEKAVRAGMEDAIREADPCLPCSTVPAGTMDLVVDVVDGKGR